MAIYISNVNGDWWEHDTTNPIYVLDTDNLTAEQTSVIMEYHGGFCEDKFEDVIMAYGKQVTLHV